MIKAAIAFWWNEVHETYFNWREISHAMRSNHLYCQNYFQVSRAYPTDNGAQGRSEVQSQRAIRFLNEWYGDRSFPIASWTISKKMNLFPCVCMLISPSTVLFALTKARFIDSNRNGQDYPTSSSVVKCAILSPTYNFLEGFLSRWNVRQVLKISEN